MIYPYSQTNRLEEPHKYMYTEFQGAPFLKAYLDSRLVIIRHCDSVAAGEEELDQKLATKALAELEGLIEETSAGSKQFIALMKSGKSKGGKPGEEKPDCLNSLAENLAKMSPAEPVATLDLLHALIAVQLTTPKNRSIKVWLDRLVQRFEVTKKLYELYPAGFRKGAGENTSIRLYWLFALALCLFYVRTQGLKYLNTLLKINDLLCSLPENMLQEKLPVCGLRLVLATEVVNIQLLAEKGGISFAPK